MGLGRDQRLGHRRADRGGKRPAVQRLRLYRFNRYRFSERMTRLESHRASQAGVTPSQAKLQGTLGVNAGSPVLNSSDFQPQFVQPGTYGVPACDASGCDYYGSLYGNSGRNIFRGPFQVRFDMSLAKEFAIKSASICGLRRMPSTSSTIPISMPRTTTSISSTTMKGRC